MHGRDAHVTGNDSAQLFSLRLSLRSLRLCGRICYLGAGAVVVVAVAGAVVGESGWLACVVPVSGASREGQTFGGSMLGIGHAIGQKWVYDQHYGVALAKRFYQNKPPTILDAPRRMQWAAPAPPGAGAVTW